MHDVLSVLPASMGRGERAEKNIIAGRVMPFVITAIVYALLFMAGLLVLRQSIIGLSDEQRRITQSVATKAATKFENKFMETLSVTAAADSWLESRGNMRGFKDYIKAAEAYQAISAIELIKIGNEAVNDRTYFVRDITADQGGVGRIRIVVPAVKQLGDAGNNNIVYAWLVDMDAYKVWGNSGITSLMAGYYYQLSIYDSDNSAPLVVLSKSMSSIESPVTVAVHIMDDRLLLSMAPATGWRITVPKAGIAAIAALSAAISLILLHVVLIYHRGRNDALHDPLTGLPNRLLLEERGRMALAHARRDKKTVAFLFIDLDGFKGVNDRYGHATGDALLRALTADLALHIRGIDTFARVGGDEFVLLLTSMSDTGYAMQVANKLLWRTGQPIVVGKRALTVGASIGISYYPVDGTDVAGLLRCADAAMYQAKRSGGGRYHIYSDSDECAPVIS